VPPAPIMKAVEIPGGHSVWLGNGQYVAGPPPRKNFCPPAFNCRYWIGDPPRRDITVNGVGSMISEDVSVSDDELDEVAVEDDNVCEIGKVQIGASTVIVVTAVTVSTEHGGQEAVVVEV